MQTAEDIFRDKEISTIRNVSLFNVTCDENGAYCRSNANKNDLYMETFKSSLSAWLVHRSKGKYFYKEKGGTLYKNHDVIQVKLLGTKQYRNLSY